MFRSTSSPQSLVYSYHFHCCPHEITRSTVWWGVLLLQYLFLARQQSTACLGQQNGEQLISSAVLVRHLFGVLGDSCTILLPIATFRGGALHCDVLRAFTAQMYVVYVLAAIATGIQVHGEARSVSYMSTLFCHTLCCFGCLLWTFSLPCRLRPFRPVLGLHDSAPCAIHALRALTALHR